MSLDDETQTRPRLWIGPAFIGLSSLLLCLNPKGASLWVEALLMLFGITVFCYHIAKWLVPF